MVLLLNAAAFDWLVKSCLYRPRILFKVICHHYTFRLHSAIMRIDIRIHEFGKCSTRTMLIKEIKEKRLYLPQLHPLVSAFPFFGHCLSSGGVCIWQEYICVCTEQRVENMFLFLSKLLSHNFQQWLLETNLFACHNCAPFHGLGQAMCSLPPCRYRRWL